MWTSLCAAYVTRIITRQHCVIIIITLDNKLTNLPLELIIFFGRKAGTFGSPELVTIL